MAFNLQTFKTRTLTAIIFAAVMLLGLLWNSWSFFVLLTVIHFGCWYEFVKLMKKIYQKKYLFYCLFGLVYITIPILLMVDLPILVMKNLRSEVNYHKFDLSFSGFGKYIFCAIIFSIWINDTIAYLVGSFIGKTPFSKISPKKTWEGTIGGIILCIIVIGFLYPLLIQKYLPPIIPTKVWFIIPALCAIFGTVGDLLESKLKRMANVKDSGSFMPGHGGFLDRFDSLLLAAPAVWIYIYFVGN